MTLVHYETSTPRPALTGAETAARQTAYAIAQAVRNGMTKLASARRRRIDQAVLDALPLDLRKDLGWPAGDITR